jgi:hypothetical protein
MTRMFASLPGGVLRAGDAIASWFTHNPMTAILVTVVVLATGWIALVAGYQRQDQRRGKHSKRADPGKPGAFPGDHR